MNKKVRNNGITRLFEESERKILSIFFTAGYPALNDTSAILNLLEEEKVDLVEIGFPFSDSLVDGPTIQIANEQSLKNGMTIDLMFEQISAVSSGITAPLIVMTCLNPVLQYGVDKFIKTCIDSGVEGLIIPDLPLEEYISDWKEKCEAAGLSMIFLITSHTDDDRIREIDSLSGGFIYVVSSDATTGNKLAIDQKQCEYFERLANLELQNPLVVGFGISDRRSFEGAVEYSSGAIIGSAFLRALPEKGSSKGLEDSVRGFVRSIRGK